MGATQKLLRFGVFELNLVTEELRKDGTPIKLPPQPLRILALLAGQGGQIVTREEIRQQIWGDETYVDFDHGMNQCIKQIRTALCDNADRPVYVETLPRRGYRFLAPVTATTVTAPGLQVLDSVSPQGSPPSTPDVIPQPAFGAGQISGDVSSPGSSAAPVLAPLPASESANVSVRAANREERRKNHRIVVVAMAAAAVLAVVYSWRLQKVSALTEKDTIVLADLINYTSDPIFDDALNPALQVELEQTPFLNLLAPDKVRGALKALSRSPEEKLTPELAREVCLRSNSKAVVRASIGDVGNGYRIVLTATDCRTGKDFAVVQMDAAGRAEIVKTLGMAGAELRGKMGEPSASLQEFNKPLEQATSSSLEALQSVSQGRKLRRQHGEVAKAVTQFVHAIELDPNYADAYLNLGISYLNSTETDLSSSNIKKAYDLRERLTQKQRFATEAFYHTMVTGDWDKSVAAYTQLTRTYPRDANGYMNLSANLVPLGQYDKAVAAAQESLRLTPAAPSFVNLMQSYVALNRLEDAKSTFEEAQAHGIDDPLLLLQRYQVAFLQRDSAGMQQQLQAAAGKPHLEADLLCADAHSEAFYGHLQASRALLNRASELARRVGATRSMAQCEAEQALLEAELGNREQAKQLTAAALSLSSERAIHTEAALALARAGDLARAEKLADELGEKYPLDTMMQNYLLPTIRAAIELERNNPDKAIEILTVTAPYEQGFDYYGAFGALYPAYLRGQAYLKLGHGQQAAAEFQKMIDSPGIVGNSVTGALAHWQLGRAQAIAGDKASARQSYDNFLALWKDADAGIPVLKQAKSEQAKL